MSYLRRNTLEPTMTEIDFKDYVEVIKDWPEAGQAVCDISRLLEHPTVFHEAVVAPGAAHLHGKDALVRFDLDMIQAFPGFL